MSNRIHNQTFFVAGVKGTLPTIAVESAVFIQLKDGQEITTNAAVPEQLLQNVMRVTDLGLLRQYWLYSLSLTIMSPAAPDVFWVLKDASIVVDISAPAVPEAVAEPRWTAVFGEQKLAGSLLINPDVDPAYYSNEYTDPVDAWSAWSERSSRAATSGNLFRFSVFEAGFYRLSAEDIRAATSATISTPPSKWRVFRNGAEVPLYADPESGDNAVFLPLAESPAEGLQEMVFWLDTSGADTENNKSLRLTEDAPVANADEVSTSTGEISSGIFRINHRQLTNYNPKLKAGPGGDRWFWADVDSDSPAPLMLTLPRHFAPSEGTTVRTTIRYGFANFPPNPPDLVLYAGDENVYRTKLTMQTGSAVLEVPSGVFKPGENPIALHLDYGAITERRPIVVQDVETQWEQELVVPEGSGYTFKPSDATSTGSLELVFKEPIPAHIAVFGVNEGFKPLPVTGSTINSGSAAHPAFYVANTKEPDSVFNLRQLRRPFSLQQFITAQSVIITTPEMVDSAWALMQNHEARGLSSTVISTHDIYNAFSYGHSDPAAIQSLLRYLFYRAAGQPPEYVTLIGEASDFRGDPRLAPPNVQLDMVPASTANSPESPQGDERYASVLGGDLVADFIVGRIPAANPEQLAAYIAKQNAYDQGPQGPWSRITQFIMDDNDEFPDVVHQITSSAMAPPGDQQFLRQWDYEYVPNMRVQGKKRSWTATKAVVDSFNDGLGVLNFFGHGGPNLWSHERLFHLSDLDLVTNQTALPLITCASCDNAWITYPMPPVNVSMGEELVLKADGGAIGLFGPVAGASPYEHSTLVQSLMEGILRVQLRRIGDAVYYSKNRYYGITRSASIPEQYLLLGDPTVSLRMPVVKPTLAVEPTEVRAGENASVRISLMQGATTNSTGTLRLVTSRDSAELTSFTVGAQENQWQANIPSSFEGGSVMVLLEVQGTGGVELSGAAFRVLPPFYDDDGQLAERTSIVGTAYDVAPGRKAPDAGAATSAVYNFQIRAIETTGSVRVVALHNGQNVGEVAQLEVTTTTQFTSFDIPVKGLISSSTDTLELEIYPHGTTNSADPVTTAAFEVPVIGAAELEFVPGTGRAFAASGEMVAGATVFLEGEIRNTGQRPAENFTIQGVRDDPSTGSELTTINDATGYRIDSLKAGESRKVVFRWESSTAGTYPNFYLVANKNKIVPEVNSNNNGLLIPEFSVRQPGNFTVSSFEVTPEYATPGTSVTVSAVFANDYLPVQRPVTVEVGWKRSFDEKTSSTRFPVEFQDGVATVTHHLIAPAEYDHVFIKVNSDQEIEEVDPGDNSAHTASIIVSDLLDFETSTSLTPSLTLGALYNLIMPFEGQLRVASEFTSTATYLLPAQDNVTTGVVSAQDLPTDGAWFVAPWRLAVSSEESPGPIGIRMKLETISHDISGQLDGNFDAFANAKIPVEIRLDDSEDWKVPALIGDFGNGKRVDFGIVRSQDGAISWQMRKAGEDGFALGYLNYIPHAVEWSSPPYLLPNSLHSVPLNFAVDTNDVAKWSSVFIDWRAGTADGKGGILWSEWNKTESKWSVPITSNEYLQLRLLGVPVTDEFPYFENFRITR